MSYENFYTAISRCTNIKNIHLNKLRGKYISEYENFNEFANVNNSKMGIIYCVNDGMKKYIGQTGRNEDIRLEEHIINENCVVFKEMKNPVIKKIGVVIGSKKMIDEMERNYIIHYKKLYGENCINLTNFNEIENKIVGYNTIGMNLEKNGKIKEHKNKFRLNFKNLINGKMEYKDFRFTKKGKDNDLNNVFEYAKNNDIIIY